METKQKISSLVNYYLREGLTDSVVEVAKVLLKRSPNDVTLQFWRAFGLYVTGNISQARPVSMISLRLRCLRLGTGLWF
jgi:hypothetical protein